MGSFANRYDLGLRISTELVHFRRRIGEAGAQLIFAQSVRVHGSDAEEVKGLRLACRHFRQVKRRAKARVA